MKTAYKTALQKIFYLFHDFFRTNVEVDYDKF